MPPAVRRTRILLMLMPSRTPPSTISSAMALSRQNLPIIDRSTAPSADMVAKGAYIVSDASKPTPDVILIATGSEVSLAMKAQKELEAQGKATRVVSMPCCELFDLQPQRYKDEVLPPSVTARLAIEAGATKGWERYVGLQGAVLGIDRFGASAPADTLFKEFGFTVEHVVEGSGAKKKSTSDPASDTPDKTSSPHAARHQPARAHAVN